MALQNAGQLLADLDGSPFMINSAGESYDLLAKHVVLIPDAIQADGTPAQNLLFRPGMGNPDTMPAPRNVGPVQRDNILIRNWWYIRTHLGITEQDISNNALLDICVIRFLAYKTGIMGKINANGLRELFITYGEVTNGTPYGDGEEAAANAAVVAAIGNRGVESYFTKMRINFTNLVCMVAYVFRTRGHHFMNGYETTYERLWTKVHSEGCDHLFAATWAHLSTIALHAVAPCVLDQYWVFAAYFGVCSGTLVKRLNAPCAGSAAIFALRAGLQDCRLILETTRIPGMGDIDAISNEVDAYYDQCVRNRWLYSVNSNLYGLRNAVLDLTNLQQICSVVMGIYSAIAANSTLLDSLSLRREANAKPITENLSRTLARALQQRLVAEVRSGRPLPSARGGHHRMIGQGGANGQGMGAQDGANAVDNQGDAQAFDGDNWDDNGEAAEEEDMDVQHAAGN